METENKNKKLMIILFIVALVVITLVLIWLFGGFKSIGKLVMYIILFCMFIAFIGFIAYIVYYIKFRESKIDITWLNKQKIIQSALMCKNKYLRDIFIQGDYQHSYIKLGRILGYTQIQCYKGKKLTKRMIEEMNPDEQQRILRETASGDVRANSLGNLEFKDLKSNKWIEIDLPEKEDIFLFKQGGWLAQLFQEYKVIRLSPDDHTELIGDVGIKAISLIKQSEYYYINKDYLDVKKIDYTLLQEAKRGITFLAFADMHDMVKTAMNLDSRFNKQMEQQGLLKEPTKPIVQAPST